MEEYLNNENELTKKFFNLEEILAFQMKYDVQIIRGGDYCYCVYINGKCYSTALTPMYALVYGIKRYKEHKQSMGEEKDYYVSGTLTMEDVERLSDNLIAERKEIPPLIISPSEAESLMPKDLKQAIDEAVDEMMSEQWKKSIHSK